MFLPRKLLALTKLSPELDHYLRENKYVQAIEEEINEPIETLFVEQRPSNFEGDSAPLHIDNPASAEQDKLGRAAFARALAERMKRIWLEINTDDSSGGDSSFVLHLHGPWGAGKTSVLNLLQDSLQTETGNKSPHDGKWIIVKFNAWRHQALNPPWWPLLNAIYRDGRTQTREYRGLWKATALVVKEKWWRLFTGRKELMLAAFLVFVLAAFVYLYLDRILGNFESLKEFADYTDDIGTILALIGTLMSAILVMSRSLLSGSIKSARAFVENSATPMDLLREHFKRLVRDIDLPIAVMIDDLDRCRRDYVVDLLEGIQTLFRDTRVIYVLAADRRWIHACFEGAYQEFAGTVNEPGRRLGSLFLEKAVQLSVSIPRMSKEVQNSYWNWLLHAEVDDPNKTNQIRTAEHERLKDATTQESVFSALAEPSNDDDPLVLQIRREAAIVQLATASVEKSTEYFLSPFAPLLDPNPRSMKRFVNAYALQRDLAVLAGLDIFDNKKRKQLALWTIISLRWPLVEEYLIKLAADASFEPDDDIKDLMLSDSVKNVLDGTIIDSALELEAVQDFSQLSGSESPEGVVA